MQLADLQTFKTKKCELNHEASLSSSYLDCVFFHSREDKRRSPFANAKTAVIYSHHYVEDFYSTQMASNLIQYLFHPNVYKTISCCNRFCQYLQQKVQAGECRYKWCPYIHEGEDLSALESYRNLPMLIPIEEDCCDSIPQTDDLKRLWKGDKSVIRDSYEDKIARFKEHLKRVAESHKEKVQVQEVKHVVEPPLPQLPQDKAQKQNWYTEYHEFYYNEKLPLIQSRHHEFKNYRDIVNNNIAPIVMKYIAAFLNSDGGVLYVGIDDNSVVSGFQMTQHEFDRFLLNIDSESKLNMLPPLMPHKYSIRRIPVLRGKRGKELWVVQVKVTPSELDKRNKVLTLYNRQAFMRMNASTHKLDPVNIIEYLRHHEEERQDQKTKMEMIEELTRSLQRKDKPISLQECTHLKQKWAKVGEKLEEILVGLKRREGDKTT